MYAFAPIIGWLTDRLGRRPIIFASIALLLAACAVAGSAGYDPGGRDRDGAVDRAGGRHSPRETARLTAASPGPAQMDRHHG